MGGKIRNLPYPKKQTVALKIGKRWCQDIIEEGERKFSYLRGGPRMEQVSSSSWGSHHHWGGGQIGGSHGSHQNRVGQSVEPWEPSSMSSTDWRDTWGPSSLRGAECGDMGSIIIEEDRVCGGRMECILAISDWGGIVHADITGFMRKQWEAISNKVNIWHLIFDSNSTTYVETYVIPKKQLNLAPCLTKHTLLPI